MEGMNWTSTQVPLWQIDCENYRRALQPFELRDVTPEHDDFVEQFTLRYDLECKRIGTKIVFYWPNQPPIELGLDKDMNNVS